MNEYTKTTFRSQNSHFSLNNFMNESYQIFTFENLMPAESSPHVFNAVTNYNSSDVFTRQTFTHFFLIEIN